MAPGGGEPAGLRAVPAEAPVRALLLGGRLLLGLLHLDLDVEHIAGELVPDVVHEPREHLEALVLVGHEGIDLGDPAEVDPLAQVVHVVQVLAPAVVDDLEQHVPLEPPHHPPAELVLALVVGVDHVLAQLLDERLAALALADVVRVVRDRVDLLELREQLVEVPVLLVLALHVLAAEPLDRVGDLGARHVRDVLPLQDAVAVLVDDLALLVHHVVVLEDALALQEVLVLDLLLGPLDLLGEHLVLDRQLVAFLVLLGEELVVEDAVDPVAREQPHQVVLGREVEAGLARVALAAGAAAQLVVDPARLVALGAEDEEAAGLHDLLAVLDDAGLHLREELVPGLVPFLGARLQAALGELELREVLLVPAQLDVHAAASHVGGDRDRERLPGLGDDLALALGVLGLRVQDRVLDAALGELPRQHLRDLHGDRAHQHRLADLVALLGLDGLVEALGPAPALQDAAGELVDDLHLAVDHRVVDVLLVERLRLQRLLEVVHEVAVLGAVQVVDAEEALRLLDSLLAHRDRLVLLLGLVVVVGLPVLRLRLEPLRLLARLHRAGQLGELVVEVGGLLGLSRDDERGARLVDEDVVDLVDDGVAVAALDLLLERVGEVVAQVVEAELRVGAVDDVARVRLHLVDGVHLRLDHADGHSEQVVDRLHPVGVAAGQVVVDRDQVDAAALHGVAVLVAGGQGVEDDRERGGERLALAGLHLGDRAVVQDHAADQPDVEVALAERAPAGLAGEGKGLEKEVVQRLAVQVALAQLLVALAQLVIGRRLELGLEVVDAGDVPLEILELLGLADPQGAVEDGHRSYGSNAGVRSGAPRGHVARCLDRRVEAGVRLGFGDLRGEGQDACPAAGHELLGEELEGFFCLVPRLDRGGRAEDDDGAVVDRVVEGGASEDETVDEGGGGADGNALLEGAEHTAGGGAVEVEAVAEAGVEGGDDDRLG